MTKKYLIKPIIEKYPNSFRRIYERVRRGEELHEFIWEYQLIMKKEGIGLTSMVYHLEKYINRKRNIERNAEN